MKTKISTNHAKRLLSLVFISGLWMAVLGVVFLLAYLFNGGSLVIRCILIQPFLICAEFASRSVWRYYQ